MHKILVEVLLCFDITAVRTIIEQLIAPQQKQNNLGSGQHSQYSDWLHIGR
jgi:hypothetical protein